MKCNHIEKDIIVLEEEESTSMNYCKNCGSIRFYRYIKVLQLLLPTVWASPNMIGEK